jgi:hypothetical protein
MPRETRPPPLGASDSVDYESIENSTSPTARAERLASLSSSIAIVCTHLTGFSDHGLLRQMVKATSADPMRIHSEGDSILGADPNLAGHLATFAAAGQKMFGQDTDTWQRVSEWIQNADLRELQLMRSGYRAICLDSLFSNAEGDKRVIIGQREGLLALQSQLESLEKTPLDSPQRFTPIGTPTDDTQFFLSGLLASRMGDGQFANNILTLWRKMGSNVWRNEGARLRSFVEGNDAAFQGKATLGDLLRFAAFSAIADPETRKDQFSQFCAKTMPTESQTKVGCAFLAMHDYLLKDKLALAKRELASLRAALDPADTYMRSFATAVGQELFGNRDLLGYLVKMQKLGRDYDTFAFLGGLLLPVGSFDATELRPLERTAGDTVASIIYGYTFRNAAPDVPVPNAKELLTVYFAGEIETNDNLRQLRACQDAAEIRRLMNSRRSSRGN